MADAIKSVATPDVHGIVVLNPDGTNIGGSTGGATSENQTSQITLATTLNSLIETLQELSQRLLPLAGAMSPTAQLRVLQTSVPSTAVTGPITSAQSIAEKAVGGILFTEKIAITNLTATQANINNVVPA